MIFLFCTSSQVDGSASLIGDRAGTYGNFLVGTFPNPPMANAGDIAGNIVFVWPVTLPITMFAFCGYPADSGTAGRQARTREAGEGETLSVGPFNRCGVFGTLNQENMRANFPHVYSGEPLFMNVGGFFPHVYSGEHERRGIFSNIVVDVDCTDEYSEYSSVQLRTDE